MKNKKGFTLIELLAVIVILGLLMAIAIPSVTKYITQSRKKTVVSTMSNYIGAMVNDINDLSYTFTESNTIYAVPIECIALERGGTSPLGEWHQANKDYWAYVLVQYDDVNSSYTYGFTFKDSSGYGIYPTTQDKLNSQGKDIKTGLELNKPFYALAKEVTALDNWKGFKVDDETQVKVLAATKEGGVGNGKDSCTLVQKGKNYETVEQNKCGDVNFDGKIDENDVNLISEILREHITVDKNSEMFRRGHVKPYDNDGIITEIYIGDASRLILYVNEKNTNKLECLDE